MINNVYDKVIIETPEEKKNFNAFVNLIGVTKCAEYALNYSKITNKEVFGLQEFYDYVNYEYDLASILFVILRIQEDLVKGFLANSFEEKLIDIEKRDSRYSKVKYYLKFPDLKHGGYLDIRTFNFESGPVSYYDAIKHLDFGDVNLVMSHLDDNCLKKFSNNRNILNDLDATRKIRNYVYHHNTLFSYGKVALKKAIILILRNLPTDLIKQSYIEAIENLRFKGSDRETEIGDDIAISFSQEDLKKIYAIKAKVIIR